jgi:hypothetical protein
MNVPDVTVRWISLDGAANARAVVPGVLLRADNLQSLTPGTSAGSSTTRHWNSSSTCGPMSRSSSKDRGR